MSSTAKPPIPAKKGKMKPASNPKVDLKNTLMKSYGTKKAC